MIDRPERKPPDHGPAQRIKEALLARHPYEQGEWIAWPEVWHIDVYAIRFWAAGQGQIRVAYEVKCSRGDFLAELRNPEKRARALELSDHYYFATPTGLVQPSELPPEAGLIEVTSGGKARVKVKAPKRQPRWFTPDEVYHLLRRDLFRTNAGGLAARARRLEEMLDRASEQYQSAREQLDEAYKALERYAGGRVQLETRWRGPWERRFFADPGPGELALVDVVELDGRWLKLRRVGAPADHWGSFMRTTVGELLVKYEPVAVAA